MVDYYTVGNTCLQQSFMRTPLILKMNTEKNFKLQRSSGMPVSDDDLLKDLRDTALKLGKETIGLRDYRHHGKFDDTTISRRFGSWNKALHSAGLQITNTINISDEQLFENLLVLWQYLGRQPRRSELAQSPSTISQTPYSRRFGSWSSALEAFVNFANESDFKVEEYDLNTKVRSTGREPSLRLRWKVLQRDNFKCKACGASPALIVGVELCVDHIIPWSKGGETIIENLQALCSHCNLGKSNIVAVND